MAEGDLQTGREQESWIGGYRLWPAHRLKVNMFPPNVWISNKMPIKVNCIFDSVLTRN